MSTVRTLQIDADGTMTLRRMPVELDALQAAVGGYIEAVSGRNWHAYMNEDGRLLKLPPNPRASTMLLHLGRPVGTVVGTVLFVGDIGPEEADVPDEVLDLARALGEITEEEQ